MIYFYQIHQLKNNPENALYRFTNFKSLAKLGLQVESRRYYTVYHGTIEANDYTDACEKLFIKFNTNHPADYNGHSISVSDIVELWDKTTKPSEKTLWYCDTIGFVQISG